MAVGSWSVTSLGGNGQSIRSTVSDAIIHSWPGSINQTHQGGEDRGFGKGRGLCRGVCGGEGLGGVAMAWSSNT